MVSLVLQFILITVAIFVPLTIFVIWVKTKRGKWRNIASFPLALAAAWCLSFALDIFLGSLAGRYSFSPFVAPIFTWLGYGIGFHFLSTWVAKNTLPIWASYGFVGSVATLSGVVGTRTYSIFVGLPLLVVAGTYWLLSGLVTKGNAIDQEDGERVFLEAIPDDPSVWNEEWGTFDADCAVLICKACGTGPGFPEACWTCKGHIWVLGSDGGNLVVLCRECQQPFTEWECSGCGSMQSVQATLLARPLVGSSAS